MEHDIEHKTVEVKEVREVPTTKHIHNNKYITRSGSSIIYIMGLIGAAVYYLSNAVTVEAVLLGLVKAILWPGFLVYQLLGFLG